MEEGIFPQDNVAYSGLSKREMFAAMALQGMLASGVSDFSINGKKLPVNDAAVIFADGLLLALKYKPANG